MDQKQKEQTEDDRFFAMLDVSMRADVETVIRAVSSAGCRLTAFTLLPYVTDESLAEFGLNSDIKITCTVNGMKVGQVEYFYKDMHVEPICHYIHSKEHKAVSTLTILRECIKQDTRQPDIMSLEAPDDTFVDVKKTDAYKEPTLEDIKHKYFGIEYKIPGVWPTYQEAGVELAQDLLFHWNIQDAELIRIIALVEMRSDVSITKHVDPMYAFAGLYPHVMRKLDVDVPVAPDVTTTLTEGQLPEQPQA